jgi:hypothetical protein
MTKLREVLEELYLSGFNESDGAINISEPNLKSVNQALSSIKQIMLEAVGRDGKCLLGHPEKLYSCIACLVVGGFNHAKADIRKEIEKL